MTTRYCFPVLHALVLLVLILSIACGRGDKSVYNLEVGDCIVPPDTSGGETKEVARVQSVDCSEPHNGEVTAVFDLDLDVDDYPGEERVSDPALEGCPDKSSTVVYPLAESWADGNREVVCILESIFDLSVGDCLNHPSGAGDELLTGVKRLDCGDPHDPEVLELFDMPGGDFPGEDGVTNYASANCPGEFDNFLGPTEESWAFGDREIVCLDE